MSFYIKEFDRTNRKTIEMLKEWWLDKSSKPLTEAVMTDFGLLCFNEEHRPIVAVFLYPVIGCDMAMVGFPIANPGIDKDERQEALKELVAGAETKARNLHYSFLVSYAGNKGAVGLWHRENYSVLDKEVVQFGKRL